MRKYDDAVPDAARAADLAHKINCNLYKSIKYVCEKLPVPGLPQSIEASPLSTLNSRSRTWGSAHLFHTSLVESAKAGDGALLQECLDAQAYVSVVPTPMRIACYGTGAYPAVFESLLARSWNAGSREAKGKTFELNQLSAESAVKSKAAVEHALNVIGKVDPLQFEEIGRYVSDITVIDSNSIYGGSSFRHLGMICVSHLQPDQGWERYYEHLVHEASHQHLFHLWHVDPIVLNEEVGRFPSPLRKDPRPLSGIFHAMFVLSRTIRSIECLRCFPEFHKDVDAIPTHYNNLERTTTFYEKFCDAKATIKKHAKLSPLGQAILESCETMVESSRAGRHEHAL